MQVKNNAFLLELVGLVELERLKGLEGLEMLDGSPGVLSVLNFLKVLSDKVKKEYTITGNLHKGIRATIQLGRRNKENKDK